MCIAQIITKQSEEIMSFSQMLLQVQGTSASGSQNLLMTAGPFVIIILIFYFFIIRPQNKKQKQLEKMLDSLKKGDKVITIGGIHGVVSSVKPEKKTVIVKVDDNTKLEFNRSAISTVAMDKPLSPEKKVDTKFAPAPEKKEAATAPVQDKQ